MEIEEGWHICIFWQQLNLLFFLVEAIPFVDLKNFPGVMELDKVIDAHSDPLTIPRGLLFGREKLTSVYVSCCLS